MYRVQLGQKIYVHVYLFNYLHNYYVSLRIAEGPRRKHNVLNYGFNNISVTLEHVVINDQTLEEKKIPKKNNEKKVYI
jgi:hypothetical protein